MSKLKITDVQVDCRNLTQDQVDKVCEILERKGFSRSTISPNLTEGHRYVSIVKSSPTKKFGFYEDDPNCTTISYEQFVNIFDTSKSKVKKKLKELEQRITLLEQKLSEKEAENSVNEVVEELPDVLKKGMRFKVITKRSEYEIKNVDKGIVEVITHKEVRMYDINEAIRCINLGIWIPLLPTDNVENTPSKEDENELVEGCVAKFWDDDENEEFAFEIGMYACNKRANDRFIHLSKRTGTSYKNARRLSKEEVIDLLFTN